MKKYKLTKDTIQILGKTLYRIKALKDFGNVKAGDLGGYIESESNLSHAGNAWVYDNALVFGNARVYGNSVVCGNAQVFDYARIYGDTKVYGNSVVYGNSRIFENARVFGNAVVSGDSELTKAVLNIDAPILYHYNITFTDHHIKIGCKQMLYLKWLEVGREDAVDMGLSGECYDRLEEILPILIKQYYGGSKL